ncbi:MAG TPA: hypothetical protein VHZ97_29510 [Pseudonocardiaceae bacterium]|jgi:hypothetical protein|nr:hypothetical protein [Pseudonocardiaceae bacterium]
MSYLRGFAPWLVYAVVSVIGWQWGALAALLVGIASFIADRRSGIKLDAQFLDIGSIVFFFGLAALAFTDPGSPLQHYDGPLSSGWLALLAIISIAVGHPFTEGIARRQVTAEVAAHPLFRRTNVVITGFWTGGFVFGAVTGVIADALGAGTMVDVLRQVLAFAIPLYLTNRYVARIRAAKLATV